MESVEFFDRLSAIPDAEWGTRFKIYLYRLWPVLIKDGLHYIAALTEAADPDFILSRYGSGRYLLMLKDQKARKLIRKHTVSVYDQDKPPRVNPLHLSDDEQNRAYLETWGQANAPEAAPPRAAGSDAAADAVRELAGIVKGFQANGRALDVEQRKLVMHAAHEAIDVVKKQYPERDNGTTPAQMISLLTQAKELLAPPAPAKSESAINELAMFREMRELFSELLEQRRPDSASQPDPMAQIRQTIGLVKSLQETFGTRATEPKWWESLLPVVPQALDRVDSIIHGLVAMRAPGSSLPAPAFASRVAEAEAPQRFSVAGPDTGQAQPKADATPAPAAGSSVADPQLVAFLSSIAGPLINALQTGLHGSDFARWIAEGYGELTYLQVQALGKEKILAALRSFPPLWDAISASPARIEQFLDEFLSEPDEASDDDSDSGSSEDPPPPT